MGAKRAAASSVSGKHQAPPPNPPDLVSTLEALLAEISASAQFLADKTDFNDETHTVAATIIRFADRASSLLNSAVERRRARTPEVVSESSFRERRVQSNSPTVLVVDDEEVVRNVTSRFLEAAGFRVIVAAGGREGLDLFERYHHELSGVLLDIMMPPMNGNLVFARMRAISCVVPVIAMSGNPDPQILSQMSAAGLRDFLPKPFTPETFFRVVDAFRAALVDADSSSMREASSLASLA